MCYSLDDAQTHPVYFLKMHLAIVPQKLLSWWKYGLMIPMFTLKLTAHIALLVLATIFVTGDNNLSSPNQDCGGKSEHELAVTQNGTTKQYEPIECKCQIYTDGSCITDVFERRHAGYGVYYGPGDSRNVSGKLPGYIQTNTRAELYAVIVALRNTLKGIRETKPLADYEIVTDAMCVIDVKRYGHYWSSRGWRKINGDPLADADLVQELYILTKRLERKCNLVFRKVKAHSGNEGNDGADHLAFRAATFH